MDVVKYMVPPGFASNQLATRCVVPFVQPPNGATRASSKPPVCLRKQGDIPGAYWAALTHPATTQEIVTRIFAGVHMLSHVVGTVNRADIRRLQQLEADNAALSARGSASNASGTKALSGVTEHSAAE